MLTIRNVHKDITAASAITALSESGLDLARLTHIAIRRTPQDLTGLGRIPGLVTTGDYCMEIELRFQGAPPSLYDLTLIKLKSTGIIRSDAQEGDFWAWHDTPGLNLIRLCVIAKAGLVPYQAAVLTGLLNSHKEATVQDLQDGHSDFQDKPRRDPNGNRGRGRRGRGSNRGRANGPGRGPPTAATQPEPSGQGEMAARGRGHGQVNARGKGRQNYSMALDEIRGQLAQLISDNASLHADNATLVAKLADGEQHSAAQNFSLADVYTGGEEDNEEYNQENGSIEMRAVAAREAGRTGPDNDTKRAMTGLPGERCPPR